MVISNPEPLSGLALVVDAQLQPLLDSAHQNLRRTIAMYGTIFRMKVQPGRQQALKDGFDEWNRERKLHVKGALGDFLFKPDTESDESSSRSPCAGSLGTVCPGQVRLARRPELVRVEPRATSPFAPGYEPSTGARR